MSVEDSDCDFSTLLQCIREALYVTRHPLDVPHDVNICSFQTDNVGDIHELSNEHILIMNDKDKEMVEEQFQILHRIQRCKISSKIISDPNMTSNEESLTQNTVNDSHARIMQEWEGKVVEMTEHGSKSVSSLDASDSSYEYISSSSDDNPYDYSRLLQGIKTAVSTNTPLLVGTAPSLTIESTMTRSQLIDTYGNIHTMNDRLFIMDTEYDKVIIEEQHQILHQIQREKNKRETKPH